MADKVINQKPKYRIYFGMASYFEVLRANFILVNGEVFKTKKAKDYYPLGSKIGGFATYYCIQQ